MPFLDGLDTDQRSRLEEAAREIHLRAGDFLLRRGDPGDHLYLLDSGTLEVRDRRSLPEVVLATVTPGMLFGEVSFVDRAPRSADVLAVGHALVLRWHREDLQRLFDEHPIIGAYLYRAIATTAVATIRALTDTRVAEHVKHADIAENRDLEGWVDRVAERFRRGIAPLEARLRETSDPVPVVDEVHHQLEALQTDVHALFEALVLEDAFHAAEQRLQDALNPWLARSELVEQSLHRPLGVAGTNALLATVMDHAPKGEGRLGEVLDAWLLERPSFQAFRALGPAVLEALLEHLPTGRPRRILFVSAGTGHLVRSVLRSTGDAPTTVTVLSQTMTGLEGIESIPPGVRLEPVKEKLVDFAAGRIEPDLWPRHVVVVHAIMEYLPSPVAVALLERCRRLLADEGGEAGCVIATGLHDAPDDALLRHLLGWPLIRRSPQGVRDLFAAAGFGSVDSRPIDAPGGVVVAHVAGRLASSAPPE